MTEICEICKAHGNAHRFLMGALACSKCSDYAMDGDPLKPATATDETDEEAEESLALAAMDRNKGWLDLTIRKSRAVATALLRRLK